MGVGLGVKCFAPFRTQIQNHDKRFLLESKPPINIPGSSFPSVWECRTACLPAVPHPAPPDFPKVLCSLCAFPCSASGVEKSSVPDVGE